MRGKGVSLVLVTAVIAGCSTSTVSPSGAASSEGASSGGSSAARSSARLVTAPSPDELELVQGFAFLEDQGWMDGASTDWAWVSSTLSADQARQAGVGALQRIDPASCEPVALMAGYGWTEAASEPSKIPEVGYAKRRSNSGQAYPTAGSIDEWESISYLLPPGRAQEIAQGLADAWESCESFALVDASGEQRLGERAHNLTGERGWAVDLVTSGNAVLRRASMEGPVGARLVTVVEPIDDVLLVTRIGIWSTDDEVWRRASQLYNDRANQVVVGSARQDVDLCSSTCG